MTCTSPLMHPHYEPGPCPWCMEAEGVDPDAVAEYTKKIAAALRCPACEGLDIRLNGIAQPPYNWCGSCGHHLEIQT